MDKIFCFTSILQILTNCRKIHRWTFSMRAIEMITLHVLRLVQFFIVVSYVTFVYLANKLILAAKVHFHFWRKNAKLFEKSLPGHWRSQRNRTGDCQQVSNPLNVPLKILILKGTWMNQMLCFSLNKTCKPKKCCVGGSLSLRGDLEHLDSNLILTCFLTSCLLVEVSEGVGDNTYRMFFVLGLLVMVRVSWFVIRWQPRKAGSSTRCLCCKGFSLSMKKRVNKLQRLSLASFPLWSNI
jgi:hypothetical protein